MPYIQREITSIESLLDALRVDHEASVGPIWYRGHADANWTLAPGYIRLANPPSEGTLLKRFRQSAAMLIQTMPRESFEWLFLMQHYGVPTRLLDWSESPLVALHFAVEAGRGYENNDGALWLLRPCILNRNAHINSQDEEGFIPSFEDDELRGYSVESLAQNRRLSLFPVATIATRNNARIQAQLGVFTIHHHDKTPIEAVGDGCHIVKYNIPHASKSLIFAQLALLGLNRFQLFPELASIGSIIKDGLL